MPKTGAGPGGKGTVNPDSYQQDSPPPGPTTNLVKAIVPTDKKVGPPKPSFLGGNGASAFSDTFWE